MPIELIILCFYKFFFITLKIKRTAMGGCHKNKLTERLIQIELRYEIALFNNALFCLLGTYSTYNI